MGQGVLTTHKPLMLAFHFS
uniref:Uncharacterized protein n=1 Tax=Anguilla anguilla TaxID=7936 RepID=A0A0E9THI5_ANGAN